MKPVYLVVFCRFLCNQKRLLYTAGAVSQRSRTCHYSWDMRRVPHIVRTSAIGSLLLASLLSGCGSGVHGIATTTGTTPVTGTLPSIWVGAWGASMTNA